MINRSLRHGSRVSLHVFLIALVLVGVGVIMVFSSSSALAAARHANSSFFLERQVYRAIFGIGVMVLIAQVPLAFWERIAKLLLIGGVVSLILVLSMGQGPAQRWLPLPAVFSGIYVQPSEFVKLALVLYLADVLARKRSQLYDFGCGFLPRVLVVAVVVGLIAIQPDLGTAIAVAMIAFTMLWVAGARITHLALSGTMVLPVIALSLYYSPYQMRRIVSFLQSADTQDASYQITQSLVALGSGGFLGVGLGNSMQKQQFLPAPHTDFVFSFIGEELGLAGTLSIVGLFVALAIHGLKISRHSQSYYGFLVATGITAMISIYATLNIGVATGALPTTGLPLPFISYGGSSLVWNLAGIGILLRVARDNEATMVPNSSTSNGGRLAATIA